MLIDYSLRITNRDLSDDFVKLITKFQLKYLKDMSYIMSKEGSWSDNSWTTYVHDPTEEFTHPHLHFYIRDLSRVCYTRMRTWISNNIGKGNAYFACKQLVSKEEYPMEYLAYILKSDPNPYVQNIPEEVIHQAIMYDLDIKLQKKKKNIPLWRECLDQLEEENLEVYTYKDLLNKVYELVMSKIQSNKVLIRQNQVISTIKTIMFHISPKYQTHFKTEVLQNIHF